MIYSKETGQYYIDLSIAFPIVPFRYLFENDTVKWRNYVYYMHNFCRYQPDVGWTTSPANVTLYESLRLWYNAQFAF